MPTFLANILSESDPSLMSAARPAASPTKTQEPKSGVTPLLRFFKKNSHIPGNGFRNSSSKVAKMACTGRENPMSLLMADNVLSRRRRAFSDALPVMAFLMPP